MKTALVCVSFGTRVPAARKNITAVEEALRAELTDADFFRVFTSPTIRRRLAQEGETILSLEETLARLLREGYEKVLVQPTHFLYGLEYENIKATVQAAEKDFASITLGVPLLSQTADLQTLAQILAEEFPQKENCALVFMGHGTPHFSNVVYPAMQAVFHMMGRRDVYVGTVEGWPEIEEICAQLKPHGYTNVKTVPFMLVAGDHALHDMAGDEDDSWKNILTREGYEVDCVLQGMGVLPGVQQLYRQHLRAISEAGRN